jgi:predicted RNase H-like nuclease (RuvC/YqgF family)
MVDGGKSMNKDKMIEELRTSNAELIDRVAALEKANGELRRINAEFAKANPAKLEQRIQYIERKNEELAQGLADMAHCMKEIINGWRL